MIYRALRRLRPHVIYQRVGCAYTAIAAQYARRHGTRLVWHVAHDTDVSPETLGSGNPLRLLIEKRSIEFGLRNATHVICQTQDQATLLRRHYNRTADAVIPNFQPKPIEDSEKATQKLVVWVANFKRWKQPDAFVRLAANLQGVAGARFIMVGARATGSRDRIWSDNLMRSIQQVPNLTYLGPQTQEEVNRLLARSHVFVNTSLHEGFPNTFIQAWMRRVPVVSLHVNPDNVFDNVSIGIHAESEDRLADSVRTLLTDESMLADYSSAAYTYAMDRHSERNGHLIARMLEFGGG